MGCHGDLLSSVEIATLTSVTILATGSFNKHIRKLLSNYVENNTQMHRFWNFSLSVKLLNIPPVRYQFEHQILKS